VTVPEEKRRWRRILRRRLASLDAETVRRHSASIVESLAQEWRSRRPAVVGLFAAMPEEPDLAPLRGEAGVKVYPRISGEDLTWWAVEGPDDLEAGVHGILEPRLGAATRIEPEEIEWILVPGLGFGRDGSRLGRGRGFYDRTLGRVRGRITGVAFGIQVEDRMPREEWDRPVAEIITESGWTRTGGEVSPGL
jgi:5-formyltetrahydrofolate cyclo-ligase